LSQSPMKISRVI